MTIAYAIFYKCGDYIEAQVWRWTDEKRQVCGDKKGLCAQVKNMWQVKYILQVTSDAFSHFPYSFTKLDAYNQRSAYAPKLRIWTALKSWSRWFFLPFSHMMSKREERGMHLWMWAKQIHSSVDYTFCSWGAASRKEVGLEGKELEFQMEDRLRGCAEAWYKINKDY